jgi:SAM-dependent methyltransferase
VERESASEGPAEAGDQQHVATNRAYWDGTADEYQAAHGAQLSVDEPGWGVWQIPEREVGILGEVRGLEVLEYGCGAGQWSIALARRGARVVGLDLSRGQLTHARALVARSGMTVPLVQADAERTPFGDRSFDVVFCDHGAMTFADPYRTVPEVARLLRRDGLFAFNLSSPLAWVCFGEAEEDLVPELRTDYFGMRRGEWEHVEFQLGYGDWIRLLHAEGFSVDDLVELRPPEGARTTYEGWSYAWARRWPAENIWVARRR